MRRWTVDRFDGNRGTRILDVGAGAGMNRDMFSDFPYVDALEVWNPFIEQYGLKYRYQRVMCNDARDLTRDSLTGYQLVLLTDVLEHLDVEAAQELLNEAQAAGCEVLVGLPFLYEQGIVDDNPHEIHLQPDLTAEIVKQRYPQLRPLEENSSYGLYVFGPNATKLEVDTEWLRKQHVAILTPTYGGHVSAGYAQSLFHTQQMFYGWGLPLYLRMINGAVVSRARNLLAKDFLDGENLTHAIWIDSDQGWTPRDLIRLLAFGLDCVGAVTRKKTQERSDWNLSLLGESGNLSLVGGVFEVEAIGTGMLCTTRVPFETLKEKRPDLKIRNDRDPKGNYYAFFQDGLLEGDLKDGNYRSEDYNFCRLWRSVGGRVWADPSACLSHFGEFDYRGRFSDILRIKES